MKIQFLLRILILVGLTFTISKSQTFAQTIYNLPGPVASMNSAGTINASWQSCPDPRTSKYQLSYATVHSGVLRDMIDFSTTFGSIPNARYEHTKEYYVFIQARTITDEVITNCNYDYTHIVDTYNPNPAMPQVPTKPPTITKIENRNGLIYLEWVNGESTVTYTIISQTIDGVEEVYNASVSGNTASALVEPARLNTKLNIKVTTIIPGGQGINSEQKNIIITIPTPTQKQKSNLHEPQKDTTDETEELSETSNDLQNQNEDKDHHNDNNDQLSNEIENIPKQSNTNPSHTITYLIIIPLLVFLTPIIVIVVRKLRKNK